MKSVGRTYKTKKSQIKKAATPTTYYGIRRNIRYFSDGSFRYADVGPILDDFDEPPEEQETCGTSDGRKYITWFASKKKRDAVLAKIKDAIFLGWEPIKV